MHHMAGGAATVHFAPLNAPYPARSVANYGLTAFTGEG
jgi:hypothetical protein